MSQKISRILKKQEENRTMESNNIQNQYHDEEENVEMESLEDETENVEIESRESQLEEIQHRSERNRIKRLIQKQNIRQNIRQTSFEEQSTHSESEEDISEMENESEQNCVLDEIQDIKGFIHIQQKFMEQISITMNEMMRKINILDTRLQRIEDCYSNSYTEVNGEICRIKEVKNENLNIDMDDVLRALIFRDYRSVLHIFKSYYRTQMNGNIYYPIRMKSKRTYEYYLRGKWLLDPNGHYITKTICNNIQNLFMRYNDIDNKKIGEDTWYENQKFIQKMSDEKFKKEIFKHIIDELVSSQC